MGKFVLTHKNRASGVLEQVTVDVDTEAYGKGHFHAVLASAPGIGNCPISDGDSIHVEEITEDDE